MRGLLVGYSALASKGNPTFATSAYHAGKDAQKLPLSARSEASIIIKFRKIFVIFEEGGLDEEGEDLGKTSGVRGTRYWRAFRKSKAGLLKLWTRDLTRN